MKTTNNKAIRALPALRDQSDFVTRGTASLNAAKQAKDYVDSVVVIDASRAAYAYGSRRDV